VTRGSGRVTCGSGRWRVEEARGVSFGVDASRKSWRLFGPGWLRTNEWGPSVRCTKSRGVQGAGLRCRWAARRSSRRAHSKTLPSTTAPSITGLAAPEPRGARRSLVGEAYGRRPKPSFAVVSGAGFVAVETFRADVVTSAVVWGVVAWRADGRGEGQCANSPVAESWIGAGPDRIPDDSAGISDVHEGRFQANAGARLARGTVRRAARGVSTAALGIVLA
jgi:hypothetical protein